MYVNLFVRTFSQALQAFTPIVFALTWFERNGDPSVRSAIRHGLILSIPATVVAAWLFQNSAHRALDEALLAMATVGITSMFAATVWRGAAASHIGSLHNYRTALWAVTGVAALIVVRQTMEIGSVLETAAIELRSFSATVAILSALMMGGCVAWLLRLLGRRLKDREATSATQAFVVLFFVQGAVYAFHESAEARLLPWSDILHSATEAYGPDGLYGVHFSDLLVIAPLIAAAFTFVRPGIQLTRRVPIFSQRQLAITALSLTSVVLMGLQGADSAPPREHSGASASEIAAVAGRPHLLFRDTAPDAHFGTLSLAPLDSPDNKRVSTALSCERVSFAAGHGLCLHATRGIFVNYTAAIIDETLKPGALIKLEGRPSRTRINADGRLGAVTVFVLGDTYAAPFSTRTTLVDMAGGDVIGELEQFTTWRNGVRFRAVDFNFWGVTFARDGNTFYATLGTGGSSYLVRGELGLRRLTVLRDNVECPALSPDNRMIAFKKHVGPGADGWRLAVLDLDTMAEHLLSAETRWVDDQVEWLDNGHVLYAVPRRTTSMSDVWVAPIEGSAPARVFLSQAESPIVVR